MILTQRKAAQLANEIYRRVHNEEIDRITAENVLRSIIGHMSDTQYHKALEFFEYNRISMERFK